MADTAHARRGADHADVSVYIEAVTAVSLPRESGLRVGKR
jgi:hypothetical protein